MGDGHFRPLGLLNPWTDSVEIWHVWLCPQSDPSTCKKWWPPIIQVGWAYGWSCTLACFSKCIVSHSTCLPTHRVKTKWTSGCKGNYESNKLFDANTALNFSIKYYVMSTIQDSLTRLQFSISWAAYYEV